MAVKINESGNMVSFITNGEISYWMECIPDGWNLIWRGLCDKINQILDQKQIQNFKIIDVKEKWGKLIIYTNISDDDIDNVINAVSNTSSSICCECGSQNAKLFDTGYIMPRCNECFSNHLYKLRKYSSNHPEVTADDFNEYLFNFDINEEQL